jgi:FdhD protein
MEGRVSRSIDYLAGEEPLEICVAETPIAVTMRTPGNDLELAAGFLFTAGLIKDPQQIASLRPEPDEQQDGANRVRVDLAPGMTIDLEAARRNSCTASTCGVSGKASMDAVRAHGVEPPNPDYLVDPEMLCFLPDKLRAARAAVGCTGALHAAALFSETGEMLVLREDVGRQHAVDKVIGWALGHGLLPLRQSILLVSGRAGFEIVRKALVAGVPVLASAAAPSDLAVTLAREFGLTLVGLLRSGRFVVYSAVQRLQFVSRAAESAA